MADLLLKTLSHNATQNFVLDLGLYSSNKGKEKEADDLKVIVKP